MSAGCKIASPLRITPGHYRVDSAVSAWKGSNQTLQQRNYTTSPGLVTQKMLIPSVLMFDVLSTKKIHHLHFLTFFG